MLAIVARLRAVDGKGGELAERMQGIAEKVRTEPGNHAYAVHQGQDDADLVMIYEQYDDQAALDAHRAHMKEMGVDLRGLLADKPELEYYSSAN